MRMPLARPRTHARPPLHPPPHAPPRAARPHRTKVLESAVPGVAFRSRRRQPEQAAVCSEPFYKPQSSVIKLPPPYPHVLLPLRSDDDCVTSERVSLLLAPPCDVEHCKPAERGLLSLVSVLRAFLLSAIKRNKDSAVCGLCASHNTLLLDGFFSRFRLRAFHKTQSNATTRRVSLLLLPRHPSDPRYLRPPPRSLSPRVQRTPSQLRAVPMSLPYCRSPGLSSALFVVDRHAAPRRLPAGASGGVDLGVVLPFIKGWPLRPVGCARQMASLQLHFRPLVVNCFQLGIGRNLWRKGFFASNPLRLLQNQWQ